MTKKGFVALARNLNTWRSELEWHDQKDDFDAGVRAYIVPVLQAENSLFDTERFMNAVTDE
jgi:hypothetical protein